jgi:S-methylmethionine-dependent homocysteine/selenocysteine methylase
VNEPRRLPQLDGHRLFLTDGGIETSLIFQQGVPLRDFAAFELLATPQGTVALDRYYTPYLELARRTGMGFVLESPTWRASADWGARLGHGASALRSLNVRAIELMHDLASRYADVTSVVSGCVGPRGDGYVAGESMSIDEAADYHDAQIAAFRDAGAAMIGAITMTNVNEAIGVARASIRHGLPVALSFTVETDGRLPSGERLLEAVRQVEAATDGAVAYFMVNCAHPSHFEAELRSGDGPRERIAGIRANASCKSHAELNDSTSLDAGDPVALGADYARLRALLPHLRVVGGCCGTDPRHVEQMGIALAA